MNSLVLGGNGFIGSHLVDKLVAEGHNVTVFDKYKEYFRSPLKEVKYIYADFGNRGEIANALNGIDMVYHLISTTHPKVSNDDPAFDVSSNVVETLFILEECVKQKISKIVFISSGGTVYGIPEQLPIDEKSSTNPICSYGITKLAIEKYLMLYKFLYGLDYVIIRPSNAYGERQNPNGIQGLISVLLGKIVKGEIIEIWGDGSIVRDYIYIKDLVNGIYLASIKDTNSKIFNIGSGCGYSINFITDLIKKITSLEFNTIYKEQRKFDIPKIYLDISVAKNQLSWQPLVSIDEGIKITWEYIKSIKYL